MDANKDPSFHVATMLLGLAYIPPPYLDLLASFGWPFTHALSARLRPVPHSYGSRLRVACIATYMQPTASATCTVMLKPIK